MQVVRDRQTNRDTGSEPDRQADTDRQQFSSVQCKMLSMRSKKSIIMRSTPSLRIVPNSENKLPFKLFHSSSD